MKKILLMLVGGTICTELNEKGTLEISKEKGLALRENFLNSSSPYAKETEIKLSENLFILSENMTVDRWNEILQKYLTEVGADNYDGVIFAHGTDTLAYSAAVFSLLLSATKIPVFFVSSNKRLSLKESNGNCNFRFAVECICAGIKANVYVGYKNISDGKTYLHLASRLCQCPNYSEDFHSVGQLQINDFTPQGYAALFEGLEHIYGGKNPVSIRQDFRLKAKVLRIDPYVGINYNSYNLMGFCALLHGSYHSGTACAEDKKPYGDGSVLHLLDLCKTQKVDLYFAPAKGTGEVYDTVRVIAEHNKGQAGFLYGCTMEMAYAKLLLAYSLFDEKEKITEFINKECNYEFFEK